MPEGSKDSTWIGALTIVGSALVILICLAFAATMRDDTAQAIGILSAALCTGMVANAVLRQ